MLLDDKKNDRTGNGPELKKPLSMWEKAKTAVVGFVGSVMNYIPRGVIMSAVFIGGAALIANLGGWDPLNMLNASFGDLLKKSAFTVAIGSAINGSIGAYKSVKAHTAFRNKEIELQQKGLLREKKRERSQEQEREQATQAAEEVFASHGLSQEVSKSTLGLG